MASIFRNALTQEGKHSVSEINNREYELVPNGAIASEDLENGALVEFDGRDSEGNLKVKYYTGTGEFYVLQNHVEDDLLIDMGETDYKNFYVGEGEMARLVYKKPTLRQETSLYTVDSGVSALALDLPVEWDASANKFKVVASSSNAIATVVGIDTDLGYNAGTETIRIQYK